MKLKQLFLVFGIMNSLCGLLLIHCKLNDIITFLPAYILPFFLLIGGIYFAIGFRIKNMTRPGLWLLFFLCICCTITSVISLIELLTYQGPYNESLLVLFLFLWYVLSAGFAITGLLTLAYIINYEKLPCSKH